MSLKVETEKLVPGKVEILLPAFSPDGRMISYIRLTDPDALNELRDLGCLSVMDARTQEEKLDIKGDLVALNYRERGRGYLDLIPVWSPDSRFVYFHYDDPAWESIGPRWSLYRADMTTGQVIRMPFPIEEYRINTIEVSPSGKWIALNSRQRWKPYERRFFWKTTKRMILADQLVVAESGGENPVNVVDWPAERVRHQEELGDFHWSPAEDLLAYIVRFRESRYKEESFLYLYDPATREIRELFRTSEHIDHFSWSPEGESVYFHTRDPRSQKSSRRYSLYRVLAASGQTDRITHHQEFFYPMTPASGSHVLLETHLEAGGRGISLMDSTTGKIQTVVKTGYNLYPVWSPTGESFVYLRTKPDAKPFWTWPAEPVLQFVKGGPPVKLAPVDSSARLTNCRPAYSPDGRTILFVAKDESEDAQARFPGLWISRISEDPSA